MSQHRTLAAIPLRAARWSATHPWRAIAAWLIFVIVATALAALVPTKNSTDADYRLGESGRADALIEAGDFGGGDSETVLITSAAGRLDQSEATAAYADLKRSVEDLPDVAAVSPLQWNPDHSAALANIELADGTDDVEDVQAATAATQRGHPELSLRQAGDISTDAGINDRVAKDLGVAEKFSLPVTLILMLLAFGALVAAGIPVLFAASCVAATMGLSAPLSHVIHAEPTVMSMIVLIGMAVGVDYSLFYLKREREERRAGATTIDAVEIAAATSGHAILVSGAAVIASMAGLFIVGDVTFNSLAAGSIVVVAVAVLGSITVLPALLVKLGRAVDRPRVPVLWRVTRRIDEGGATLINPVIKHPVVSLVLAVSALLALAAPALGMTLHSANLDTQPSDIPEVATLRALSDKFPTEGTTASIVVRGSTGQSAEIGAALARLESTAAESDDFTALGPDSVRTSADGRTSVLDLGIAHGESDEATDTAIRQLRADLVPDALAGLVVQHAVGGDAAESMDYVDRQNDRMPWVIGFVLLLTLVMMAFAFRSVALAVISSGLNLLSVGVAFGVLTLIFQHGWLAGPLGFTSPGFIIGWLPLFVMVILVGLSMDYHVFVLSRVREYADKGLPMRLAVRRGIGDSAGVVSSAAAVMVSVFAIFATLSMLEMKMMGVALSVSILIDATLIRLVVLPAVLVLLGEKAWWPRRPVAPLGELVDVGDAQVLETAVRSERRPQERAGVV